MRYIKILTFLLTVSPRKKISLSPSHFPLTQEQTVSRMSHLNYLLIIVYLFYEASPLLSHCLTIYISLKLLVCYRMLQSPSASTKLKGENLFNYISLENSGTNIAFS